VRALPNLAARSYRCEVNRVRWRARPRTTAARPGRARRAPRLRDRRGRDLRAARGEVVIERGLAREWGLQLGDDPASGTRRRCDRRHRASPDNVAYPARRTPRVYVRAATAARPASGRPNLALLWLTTRPRPTSR
jgi:hypothetical protein